MLYKEKVNYLERQPPSPSENEGMSRKEKAGLIKHLIMSARGARDALQEKTNLESDILDVVFNGYYVALFDLNDLGIPPEKSKKMVSPLSELNKPNIPEEGNKQETIADVLGKAQTIEKLIQECNRSPIKVADIPITDENGKADFLTLTRTDLEKMRNGCLQELIALQLPEDVAREALGMALVLDQSTVPDANKQTLIAEKKRQAENIKAFLKEHGHNSSAKNISLPFYRHGQFDFHIQTKGFVRILHGIYNELVEWGVSKEEALALTGIDHYQKPINPPQETTEDAAPNNNDNNPDDISSVY